MFRTLFSPQVIHNLRERAGQRPRLRSLRRRLILEKLENRLAPTVTTQGIPSWTDQGPGPMTGGQVQNIIPRPVIHNPVAGAVSALASHPTDANILYAATVNGGIWKTSTATQWEPNWFALTDAYPSLSMGDISMSPADPNVVYAGTARVSSSRDGAAPNGLLRTTDAGSTWTMLGQSDFSGQDIIKVLPTALGGGAVVVVATSAGVYRSSNSGANWALLSGTGGLPVGGTTDMVRDPANVNRFYVAVTTGQRVYRTEDGGLNWVAAPLPATASRIRLTVGAGGTVYAATMNSQLTNVFRSATLGGSWASMGVPSPTIHPGEQADTHFSFLGDRADPNVVFIGGDRQDIPFVNGCNDYTGNHFRGVFGSGWTSMDCNGATFGGLPTSPHADSRAMAFDANGRLLEADDGGIYRLVNPNGAANTRQWTAMIGSGGPIALTPTEFYSVAYDSLNHIIIGGAQDTGSAEQTDPNSFVWRSTTDGDGGVAAVGKWCFFGCSTNRYSSVYNLGGFKRRTFNSSNQLVATSSVGLAVNDTSTTLTAKDGFGQFTFDTTIQFIQPYVLNNANPFRMVIGTNFLYESADQGDDITSLGGLDIDHAHPTNPVGRVRAIDYGGFSGGVANQEVLYIGAGSGLRLRTSGTGLPSVVTTYPGSSVQSVRMDPTEWHTAYVLDSAGRVWRTTDAGATAGGWTNLTGNLPSLTPSPRTIEVVHSDGNVALLVGGQGGVYRALNPGGTGTWSRFGGRLGSNLSNAIVSDMHYNAADDVLIVGTLGRGAWKVASASATLFQASIVTVVGTAGNDTIRLARDPNIPGILNIFLNSSAPVFSVVAAAVQQVIVNGLGGNDTINIDDTFPLTPVTVNMSSAGCTVNISSIEHNLSHIQANVLVNGATSGFDSLNVNDQNSGTGTYTLTSSSLTRSGSATIFINNHIDTITLNGSNGANTYNVNGTNSFTSPTTINTGTGNDIIDVEATTRPLFIQEQGAGNDIVHISQLGHTLSNIQGRVTVNGNSGVDTLNVNDQNGPAGVLTYALASNSVSRGGAVINYAAMNFVVVNGSNGPDTYNITGTENFFSTTVNGGTGDNTVNVFATSGALAVNSGSGNAIINVGSGGGASTINNIQGNVTINGQAASNSLFINDQGNASAVGRVYTITATTVSRTGPPNPVGTIAYNNIQTLVVSGSGSSYVLRGTALGTTTTLNTGPDDDTIAVGDAADTLNGIQGFLIVNGQVGTNTLILNDQGNGSAQTYTLAANTVARSGMATISLLNVQILTLNGGSGGGSVTALGTSATTRLNGNAAGVNTLVGGNVNTTWNITSADAGNMSNANATVAFANYQNVTGGSGDDRFVFGDGASLSGTLDGGGGTNTLDSSANSTPESFAITGLNAGLGTPVTAFANIQNLIGGAGGSNSFAFSDGGSLGGNLNGGTGGNNTLDYSSGWSGNVLVNLRIGAASGIGGLATGHVSNIQNALGAGGGGAGFYNILVGNGGNYLQGGNGRRNLLTAGASASTLVGGDDDDILIGGTTAYDLEANVASLIAIMTYWSGPDNYATRVSNLTSGTGVPLLDATKVTGNGGGNTLTGHAGGATELNLFFGDLVLDVYDWNPLTETFIPV